MADGASTSVRAQANETVRTLTGEYCLREGTYSKTLPDNLGARPGTPCLRVDAITCVRWEEAGDSLGAPVCMPVGKVLKTYRPRWASGEWRRGRVRSHFPQ